MTNDSKLYGIITPKTLVSNLKKELELSNVSSIEIEKLIVQLEDLSEALDYSAILAITDRRGTILSVNDTFCRLSKYSREELIGKNHSLLKSGFHSDEFFADMWKTIREGKIWEGEVKNKAKDGSHYWVKTTIFPVLDEEGVPYKFISVRTDITEGKNYEDKVRELLKNDFFQVMRSLDNFVFKLKKSDEDYEFSLIAGKLAEELGLHEQEHIYKPVHKILPMETYKKLLVPVENTFLGTKSKFELKFLKKYLFVTLSPIYRDGQVEEIVGSVSDITDLKNSELIVEHMAYHDSLTDLPNRRLLDKDLTELLMDAKEMKKNVGLLFLDLDHFKHINDTFGHSVGDYILIMAAHRLQKIKFEEVGQMKLYHLGGDEFAFIFYDFADDYAHEICNHLLNVFQSPFLYKQADIHLKISLGMCNYPAYGESPEDLVKNADIALFAAKDNGRNKYLFYTLQMNESLVRKLQIENDLRKALDRGNQLKLHYQPQVDLKTNNIIGFEALIRWIHPEKGFISPAHFIQVAEDTGLIIPLGDWVLREACMQLKKWQKQGYHDLRISVNIATKQFQHPDFVKNVNKVLNRTGLSPNCLELEITENSLLDITKETIDTLTEIKNLGIQLAIDDFGTGYSSLSYLKSFPITTLKIDQTFVYELPQNSGDRAIVSSIISLAHNLGLRVIAEGVENQAALDFLKSEKCDEMQGYFFSKPLPADDLQQLLQKHAIAFKC